MVWLILLYFSIIASISGFLFFIFNTVNVKDIVLLIVFIVFDFIFYILYKESNRHPNETLKNNENYTKGGFFMSQKWYLQTWFISILFAFWFLIIPGIAGLILLVIQIIENRKIAKKYCKVAEIDNKIIEIENIYSEKSNALDVDYNDKKSESENKIRILDNSISDLERRKRNLLYEIESLQSDTLCAQYNFSDYDGLKSEECKNKLSLLKLEEQEKLKNNLLIKVNSECSKKVINDNIKQILRCFNAECDNIFLKLSHKNIDTMRNKITKSYETLNKIFYVDGIQLRKEALEIKLEELNLIYTYELKHAQEIELQKEIKAQMIEEEKVRREIEKQKAKIEKDMTQFSNEINKLMKYMQKTQDDIEKQLYIDKIRELENRLSEMEKEKESVLQREQNARAGFVYVISNIGSFGENIYKIGMTRRLEPMDRIKELSSASVPFEFDVHAMIFSEDAPSLETALHKQFENNSVNKINLRKEFFNVSIDEIESVVKNNFDETVEFVKIPPAEQYRQSQMIRRNLGQEELSHDIININDDLNSLQETTQNQPIHDPNKEYLYTKWGTYEMPEKYKIELAYGDRKDLVKVEYNPS